MAIKFKVDVDAGVVVHHPSGVAIGFKRDKEDGSYKSTWLNPEKIPPTWRIHAPTLPTLLSKACQAYTQAVLMARDKKVIREVILGDKR